MSQGPNGFPSQISLLERLSIAFHGFDPRRARADNFGEVINDVTMMESGEMAVSPVPLRVNFASPGEPVSLNGRFDFQTPVGVYFTPTDEPGLHLVALGETPYRSPRHTVPVTPRLSLESVSTEQMVQVHSPDSDFYADFLSPVYGPPEHAFRVPRFVPENNEGQYSPVALTVADYFGLDVELSGRSRGDRVYAHIKGFDNIKFTIDFDPNQFARHAGAIYLQNVRQKLGVHIEGVYDKETEWLRPVSPELVTLATDLHLVREQKDRDISTSAVKVDFTEHNLDKLEPYLSDVVGILRR